MSADAARLAELIRSAGSVVALTGAGISAPSGIPDFRTPGTGLWENVDPMEVAHIDVFRRDPERFWHFYGHRFASLRDKRPTGAHAALVALEQAGQLDAVVTQNIDGLHAAAGTRELVEVHGSIAHATCLHDGASSELEEVRSRLADAPDGVPRCDCGRPLKPGVVLFGEYLPRRPCTGPRRWPVAPICCSASARRWRSIPWAACRSSRWRRGAAWRW